MLERKEEVNREEPSGGWMREGRNNTTSYLNSNMMMTATISAISDKL